MIKLRAFNRNSQPIPLKYMDMVHRTKEGRQLWLGDYLAAKKLPLLKQHNIHSVLTAAAMLNIIYPEQLQINHKIINAIDEASYKMAQHFQEAYQFISGALERGNILVHCAAGISRSATFVLAYLMRAEQMSYQQAYSYLKSRRTVISPNGGFQKELKRYQLVLIQNVRPAQHQIIVADEEIQSQRDEEQQSQRDEEQLSQSIDHIQNGVGNISPDHINELIKQQKQ